MVKKKFGKGKTIFDENSEGSEMYIILSGSVRIFKTINGEEVVLGTLKKYDFFGELGPLLSLRRTASVAAVEETELLCLSKEALLTKIRDDAKFAERLVTTLASKVAQSDVVISELAGEKRSLEIIYGVK